MNRRTFFKALGALSAALAVPKLPIVVEAAPLAMPAMGGIAIKAINFSFEHMWVTANTLSALEGIPDMFPGQTAAQLEVEYYFAGDQPWRLGQRLTKADFKNVLPEKVWRCMPDDMAFELCRIQRLVPEPYGVMSAVATLMEVR